MQRNKSLFSIKNAHFWIWVESSDMARVAVLGSGIAGKAFLSLLLRSACRNYLESIVVIDKPQRKHDLDYLGNSVSGLWPIATQIMHERMNISNNKLLDYACPVVESGYRSVKGKWLARPSPMKSPPGKVYQGLSKSILFLFIVCINK
jgi:hypothetical protein